MPSGLDAKIHAIIKVVRRTQTFCATTAAVSLGSITTLFFLPVSVPVRITLLIPGLLFFSRKIYVFVFTRQATEKLAFEEQFLSTSDGPDHLLEAVSSSSQLWTRSAIVRSIRRADYRPFLDPAPANVVARKLEKQLKISFSASMLPRPLLDHGLLVLWIASWVYVAILHPSPNVWSATVLLVSGLTLFASLAWIELAFGLATREQRHRLYVLYWDLAEWLLDRFEEMNTGRTAETGYRRTEHFRDTPWFPGSRKRPENTDAGGLS